MVAINKNRRLRPVREEIPDGAASDGECPSLFGEATMALQRHCDGLRGRMVFWIPWAAPMVFEDDDARGGDYTDRYQGCRHWNTNRTKLHKRPVRCKARYRNV